MKNMYFALFAGLLIIFPILSINGQKLNRTGLLFEDLSKIPWIKHANITVAQESLLPEVDLSPFMPPVGNQGEQSSCVGWAFGYYYKTYQEWQDYGWSVLDSNHRFSPSFIYNHLNCGIDGGAYFSDAMKLLIDNGVSSIRDFPYNQYSYTAWPTESVYVSAINYRCSEAFYFYTNTIGGVNQIKQLLNNNNPVILGISVWGNFDNIKNYNNTYCVANLTGTNRGGHAVTIIGYDDTKVTADGIGAFKVINSWGTAWGASGYFWMSYPAVMNATLSSQFACFVTDREQYQPTVIAKTRINHGCRNTVSLKLGIGNGTAPLWEADVFNFEKFVYHQTTAVSYPDNNIVFDLTDGDDFLKQSQRVFLKVQDNYSDIYNGTVEHFSVTNLTNSANTASVHTPAAIPFGAFVELGVDLDTLGAPLPPSNLTVQTAYPDVINLNWTANTGNPSIYRIYRSNRRDSGFVLIDSVSSGTLAFSDSGLNGEWIYYYYITAVNGKGQSLPSNTTEGGKPLPPLYLAARTSSSNGILLNWNRNAGGPERYRIFRSLTSGTDYVQIDSVSSSINYYEDCGLNFNVTYYYSLKAVNDWGDSPYSNEVYATTVDSMLGFWNQQASPVSNDLLSIWPVNSQIAWAAGEAGTVIRTTDGGVTWEAKNIPLGPTAGCITASSDLRVWLGGADGSIWSSTDGGNTWINSLANLGGGSYVDGIWAFNDSTVITVGDPTSGTPWPIKKTTDAGATWFNPGTAPTAASNEWGYTNSFWWTDQDHGWIGTNKSKIYRTTNGGLTWQSGLTSTVDIYGVSFLPDHQNGIAGFSDTPFIKRTTNGGVSWTVVTNPVTEAIFGVHYVDTDHAWICTQSNIFIGNDSGQSWTSYGLNINGIRHMKMANNSAGWLVGNSGLILKYSGPLVEVKDDIEPSKPDNIILLQNYPNPFNPTTTIGYQLPAVSNVEIKIYNSLGQSVRALFKGIQSPGRHELHWDGKDDKGNQVATGVYIYRLSVGGFVKSRKMILLK